MNINFIFSLFSPKDRKFFPLLQEASGIITRTSANLESLFICTEEAQKVELCKLIKEEELKGDKVTSYIHKALYENFLTPFDREDIDELADQMDDCIDAMNRTAQKVLLYSPKKYTQASVDMTNIIKSGVAQVDGAISEMASFKKKGLQLRKYYKQIKELEEMGDRVYEKGIIALFKDEPDTIELIKQKEILQELEKTVNKINNIGKILKSILIKYA